MQDYRRLQAKVEKYEEKEKTGPVLAKLHQVPRRGVRVGTHWGDTCHTWKFLLHLGTNLAAVGPRHQVF